MTQPTSSRISRYRCPLTRTALLLVAAALAGPAAAQPTPASAPGTTPAPVVVPDTLEPEPFLATELGFSIHLPRDAKTRITTPDGGGRIYEAIDVHERPRWWLRIQTLASTLPDPSPRAEIEDHLGRLMATDPPPTVLALEPLAIAGAEPGQLLYARQETDTTPVISGWLVLPHAPATFIVVTIIADPATFDEVRPLLDTSFATIRLKSRAEVVAEADTRLIAGRSFVQTISRERLEKCIHPIVHYRIYDANAKSDAIAGGEIGWMSVEAREGVLGEVDQAKEPIDYTDVEFESGLLVIVRARLIEDPVKQHYQDIERRHWLAWDRLRETWSGRITRRHGAATQTSGETGVRSGTRLTVIQSTVERQSREPKQFVIPDKAYLSAAEVLVFGRLLPRDGRPVPELELYSYDTESGQIRRRRDHWSLAPNGTDWILETLVDGSDRTLTQTFGPDGIRLRRIDSRGIVTERTDYDRLMIMWQRKGLK
jgi:hypothetical protein